MLQVSQLIGFGAFTSGAPASVVFVDSLRGVVTKSCSLGTSQANRKIVLVCGKDNTTDNVTVTVGGVSATKFATGVANTDERATGFYYDMGAGNTTDTVTFSNGGTAGRFQAAVFAVYGAVTGAPSDIQTDSVNTNPTCNLSVTASGIALGFIYHRTNSERTYSWSGLTSDYDAALVSSFMDASGASSEIATTTTQTTTVTPSGSGVRVPLLLAASYSAA